MDRLKNIFSDREFWFILFFNGFLAWGYFTGYFSMDTLVWIYFLQSVMLGIGNVVRMACLKSFSTKNFQVNGQSVEPTAKTKGFSAAFFALHYGFFHFVYFIFLVVGSINNGSKLDFRMVLINFLAIVGNTIFSTWSNVLQDREDQPSIAAMFFTPYLRVVPMHIFIIVGFVFKTDVKFLGFHFSSIHSFWLFLILKSLSDLLMHIIVQKSWRGKRIKPVEGYI